MEVQMTINERMVYPRHKKDNFLIRSISFLQYGLISLNERSAMLLNEIPLTFKSTQKKRKETKEREDQFTYSINSIQSAIEVTVSYNASLSIISVAKFAIV